MTIQSNESNFKEEDTTRLFDNGNPSECDANIAYLMQINNTLKEKVTKLKREHEIQAIKLCEEIKIIKKVVEDKVIIDDDIRILRNRLDEKIYDVQKLTNTQLELMNQAMVTNQELMTSDHEIATLKMQNEQLQNELKAEKELTKRMNKSSEAMRYFENLLRLLKSINDTSGLGYVEKG